MAQAKVVSEQELKRALGVISGHRHAQRDRMALLLTHWAGTLVYNLNQCARNASGLAGRVL